MSFHSLLSVRRRHAPQPGTQRGFGQVMMTLSVFVGACGGGEPPLQVPKQPPETLAVLVAPTPESEQMAGDGTEKSGGERARLAFPLTKQPVRRDACGIPIAVSPVLLMRPGSVERLQQRLLERKFLEQGAFATGELDAATLTALAKAQDAADLPVVGIPNYATLEALDLSPVEIFMTGEATCEGGDG